ncbi:MAG: ribosome small subunit-dependent GTPase A, partial [Frankiaceae bacterium]
MSPRELDEDDVRVRPGRGSRPRTRERPAYTDAVEALVVA